MSNTLPKGLLKHLRMDTTREWKELKRQQLRRANEVMEDLAFGSSFLPTEAYYAVCEAHAKLDKVKEILSQKNWGR